MLLEPSRGSKTATYLELNASSTSTGWSSSSEAITPSLPAQASNAAALRNASVVAHTQVDSEFKDTRQSLQVTLASVSDESMPAISTALYATETPSIHCACWSACNPIHYFKPVIE
eukprot:17545-Heterococcus_DN1.PRE.2